MQTHIARWFLALHSALTPQVLVWHGSLHFSCIHARWKGHSGSDLHSGLGAEKIIMRVGFTHAKCSPIKFYNFTESCLCVGGVLTWTAVGCRWANVTIRTSTNRLMIYDLAIRVSTTGISNDAGIDTLTILACIIKRAIVVNIASNRKLGWGW